VADFTILEGEGFQQVSQEAILGFLAGVTALESVCDLFQVGFKQLLHYSVPWWCWLVIIIRQKELRRENVPGLVKNSKTFMYN